MVGEEIFSAVLCFVLVWFLIKPYHITREGRYLGLPLGFGILGISYSLSAYAHSYPIFMDTSYTVDNLTWLQLLARPFAFAFLMFTYYFSRTPSKNTRLIWDITLSALLVALTSIVVLVFVAPQFTSDNYSLVTVYIRIVDMICLSYISIHTLRTHSEAHGLKTILTPFGFIFLGISQYSLLVWAVDMNSKFPFYGGLVLRWVGLILFLLVAYRTFYRQKKEP